MFNIDYQLVLNNQKQNIMKSKLLFMLFLLPFLFGSSCKKEMEQINEGLIDAIILDGGPIQTEQCGWILKVSDKYYYPVNLPKDFEQDKINVFVKYELLNEDFICGNTTTYRSYKKIKITDIKKK